MKAVKIRTFVLFQVVRLGLSGSLLILNSRVRIFCISNNVPLTYLFNANVHATYHRVCAVHRVPPVPVVQFSKVYEYIDCTVKLQIQGPMEWEFYYLFSYLANCLLIGYFKFKTLP